MSDVQSSEEQILLQQSLPGKPVSPASCLASARDLKGRVVVVTGAGSGFGAAYARLAASHGARVVASDVDMQAVENVAEEIGGNAMAIYCDTSDWDSQVAMFKAGIDAFGPIDVVVANAGVTEMAGWFEESLNEAGDPKKPNMTTIDVNLLGATYTARLAFHYLPKNPRPGKKSLVLVGSIASFFPIPGAPMYVMSKHAMLGLFRTLHYTGQHFNINVNLLAPWFCSTGIISAGTAALISGFPLAKVEDVAYALLKVSADETCNGEILAVDAKGILSIPSDALMNGEGNFHHALIRRGSKNPSGDGTARDSHYHELVERANNRS